VNKNDQQEKSNVDLQIEEKESTNAMQFNVEDDNIPPEFLCPITQDIMDAPVIDTCGHTYDRESIEGWIAGKDTCPMTNKPFRNNDKTLTPIYSLKTLIDDFKNKQKEITQQKRQNYYELIPQNTLAAPTFFNDNNCCKLFARAVSNFFDNMIDYLTMNEITVKNPKDTAFLFVEKTISVLRDSGDTSCLTDTLEKAGASSETINFITYYHSRNLDLNYASDNRNFTLSIVNSLKQKNITKINALAGTSASVGKNKGDKGIFSFLK